MKTFILLVVIVCCSISAMAQDSLYYKHTFKLQISAAIPTGDFKETKFEDDYPDFAMDGILISASYQKLMNRYILLGSSVHYRSHKFGLDDFASEDDELVLERDSKPWRSWFTMADVYLQTPEGKYGNYFLKGSVGSSFNRSAYVNVLTAYGPIELPADNATAFAWGYGGGVQVYYNAWCLVLELSQVHTAPTFMVNDTKGNVMKHKQPMNSFNIGIGISYSL